MPPACYVPLRKVISSQVLRAFPSGAPRTDSPCTAGRARWKIENEGNHTLNTQGYHFKHNFGHGTQHLSNLLTTMNLLAYLLHTTLDLQDTSYRSIRGLLPSRRTFFEHLRALLQYFPFDSWDHLMAFMLNGLASPPPATG